MPNRRDRRAFASKLRKVPTRDLTKIVLPTMSATGSPLQGCYAHSLGNCEGGMSREHFISKNILDQFDELSPKGVPWLQHLDGHITPKALVVKCLCEKHNNFLSPLDQLAGKTFIEFKRFGEPKQHAERVNISGNLFERWILKLLLGVLATGKFSNGANKMLPLNLEPSWIRCLFGLDSFPPGCGLHVMYKVGEEVKIGNFISFSLSHNESQVLGLTLDLAGFRVSFLACT